MINNFTITNEAYAKIASLLKNKNKKFFRAKIDAGGCSGFQYIFEFADNIEDDDYVIEKNDTKILIDKISCGFLEGCELHFNKQIVGESFEIKNPNAKSSCGCGISFSI